MPLERALELIHVTERDVITALAMFVGGQSLHLLSSAAGEWDPPLPASLLLVRIACGASELRWAPTASCRGVAVVIATDETNLPSGGSRVDRHDVAGVIAVEHEGWTSREYVARGDDGNAQVVEEILLVIPAGATLDASPGNGRR